jgi:hypothetical protein
MAGTHSQHRLGVALIVAAAVAWSTAPFFTRLLPFDSWTILFRRGLFATRGPSHPAWSPTRWTVALMRIKPPSGVARCHQERATIFLSPEHGCRSHCMRKSKC